MINNLNVSKVDSVKTSQERNFILAGVEGHLRTSETLVNENVYWMVMLTDVMAKVRELRNSGRSKYRWGYLLKILKPVKGRDRLLGRGVEGLRVTDKTRAV